MIPIGLVPARQRHGLVDVGWPLVDHHLAGGREGGRGRESERESEREGEREGERERAIRASSMPHAQVRA